MGFFRRSAVRTAPVSAPEPEPEADASAHDRQLSAIGLAEDFHGHDMALLATLSPAERAEQYEARRVLFEYVDRMWDAAKLAGHRPADHPERYGAVAGMRDLASELYFGNIEQARHAAGDPDN